MEHTDTESFRLEETFVAHLVQPPAQSMMEWTNKLNYLLDHLVQNQHSRILKQKSIIFLRLILLRQDKDICIILEFTVSHHSTITFLFVLVAGESIYYSLFVSMI